MTEADEREMQMNEECTLDDWGIRAAFYELLAKSLLYPTRSLADAVVSGDFADAAEEICSALGEGGDSLSAVLETLGTYGDRDGEAVLHDLRVEYTRLFIGAPTPVVSPYGGVWQAMKDGKEPILFVGKETLAVEQIMRAAGVGNPQGIKEPLDHIGCELEFLQYLCLVMAGVERAHEKADIGEADYREFLSEHVRSWNRDLAGAIVAQSTSPFYQAAAQLLTRV